MHRSRLTTGTSGLTKARKSSALLSLSSDVPTWRFSIASPDESRPQVGDFLQLQSRCVLQAKFGVAQTADDRASRSWLLVSEFGAHSRSSASMDGEMLPPPKRPQATPLSNADFRQFLETPRRDAPTPSLGQTNRQKGGDRGESQAQRAKKSHKPRRKPEAEDKDTEEDLYRQAFSSHGAAVSDAHAVLW